MPSGTPSWIPLVVAGVAVLGSIITTVLSLRASKKRDDERWDRERNREDQRWNRERERENERWQRESEADEVRWKRQKLEQLRERRVALYVDMAEYLQRRESSLPAITDPDGFTSRRGPEGLVHPELLSARVKILAPGSLIDAWSNFDAAEDELLYSLRESGRSNAMGEPYLEDNDASVTALNAVIGELRKELKLAMIDPDATN